MRRSCSSSSTTRTLFELFIYWFHRQRNRHDKAGIAVGSVAGRDGSVQQFNKTFRDEEAEAEARRIGARISVETLEYPFKFFRRGAAALIQDLDEHPVANPLATHAN